MNKVDKQALREAALRVNTFCWGDVSGSNLSEPGNALMINERQALFCLYKPVGGAENAKSILRFIAAANPATILALLDENEELEKRVVEMASENAALKNYQPSPTSAAVFEAIEITESLFDEGRPELAMIMAFNIMKMKRSPSTDSFINEMRAQGVEMLADLLSGMNISVSETSVREFARNLREPKA